MAVRLLPNLFPTQVVEFGNETANDTTGCVAFTIWPAPGIFDTYTYPS